MANKLWIRAKICETLMEQGEIHYRKLFTLLDPSCHKDAIEVLAVMYDENHIWSTHGIVKWNHCEEKKASVDISELTTTCQMIANYAKVKWDLKDRLVLP